MRSAGGLATGLLGAHEASNSLWIGWPGDTSALSTEERAEVEKTLAADRLVPVTLSQNEIRRYYEGYSNGMLWPLFHYLTHHLPHDSHDWNVYRRVNQRFADAVVKVHQPGDIIWVHDYQLLLVPAMIREKIPNARIGLFLHIPFPSFEMFRLLARRAEILRGMLGADLLGFHTLPYVRHFADSVERILGMRVKVDHVEHENREITLGVFPMGVDAKGFDEMARRPDVDEEVKKIRDGAAGQALIVGIDRLDYTKGIRRRILAVEKLLEREPALRGKLRYIQVAVPSRTEVAAYATLRREVDELVGNINGRYATPTNVPIHYMFRSLPPAQVTALYRAADVMLVTPLRDGMNLVAKEFVASRHDEDGVLVLSELAGAAAELVDAVTINPYDVDGTASGIRRALSMAPRERQRRMRALRSRVFTYDIHRWQDDFVKTLEATRGEGAVALPGEVDDALAARIANAAELSLFLDYDGTLVPFGATPADAEPDPALLDLLARVAARPKTSVHIVSGRPRQALERWLGHLNIGLHGEHGLWSRMNPADEWSAARGMDLEWRPKVSSVVERYVQNTPGSFLEEKSGGMAWHYRLVDPDVAAIQARALWADLTDMVRGTTVDLLDGERVIEIRMGGVNKGLAISKVLAGIPEPPLVVAIGDDRTDRDLFAAVPRGGIAIEVGRGFHRAPYRVSDYLAVRALLERLAAPVRQSVPPPSLAPLPPPVVPASSLSGAALPRAPDA